MRKVALILTIVLYLAVLGTARATLIDRGGGLIYDTDFDITWLQNANLNGSMDWDTAKVWAATLVFGGFDDWRLPTALNTDGTGPCSDIDCTDSEMGHLYYTE